MSELPRENIMSRAITKSLNMNLTGYWFCMWFIKISFLYFCFSLIYIFIISFYDLYFDFARILILFVTNQLFYFIIFEMLLVQFRNLTQTTNTLNMHNM